MNFELNKGYSHLLQQLKDKIRQAKIKVSHTANKQLLKLYWEIGNVIFQQEQSGGWSSKTVETLARDFKVEFPDMTGFSKRNLRYMRDFSAAYPILQLPVAKLEGDKIAFAQPVVTQIPRTHHTIILDKVKSRTGTSFLYPENSRKWLEQKCSGITHYHIIPCFCYPN